MIGCKQCERWIENSHIPNKVIILRCSTCRTTYTLFPNGQIASESRKDNLTSSGW